MTKRELVFHPFYKDIGLSFFSTKRHVPVTLGYPTVGSFFYLFLFYYSQSIDKISINSSSAISITVSFSPMWKFDSIYQVDVFDVVDSAYHFWRQSSVMQLMRTYFSHLSEPICLLWLSFYFFNCANPFGQKRYSSNQKFLDPLN